MLETSQKHRFIEPSSNNKNNNTQHKKQLSQTYHPNHSQVLKDNNNCRKLSIDSRTSIYKSSTSISAGCGEHRVGIGVSSGSLNHGPRSSSLSAASCKERGKIEKSVSFIDQNTNRMAGTMKQGKRYKRNISHCDPNSHIRPQFHRRRLLRGGKVRLCSSRCSRTRSKEKRTLPSAGRQQALVACAKHAQPIGLCAQQLCEKGEKVGVAVRQFQEEGEKGWKRFVAHIAKLFTVTSN
jgi:hypothetical protein